MSRNFLGTARGFGILALFGLGFAAGGCDTGDVQAILIGIEAATNQLEDNDQITFSDWLQSELDD